jgi:hypothetical protein
VDEDIDDDADDVAEPAEFYCTRDDLLAVLQKAEKFYPLTYVRIGHYPSPTPDIARCARDIPGLGTSPSGQHVLDPAMLILLHDEKIVTVLVTQASGKTTFFVGPERNGKSVTFVPGGRYKESCLIQGSFHPTAHNLVALGVYENLLEILGRQCVARPGCLFVGQEALELLRQGVRLTRGAPFAVARDLEVF